MDRGLSEILSKFSTGALVCLLVGSSCDYGCLKPFPWYWNLLYLAGITDVDRGLSEILSGFGASPLVHLLIGSSVTGSSWWFRIPGFVPVVPDLWVSSCGSGCLDPFPGSWNTLYLAEIADVDRGLSEIPSG